MYTDISTPCHITLSSDPIDDTFNIPVTTSGMHTTLGLVLEYDKSMNRVKLINCIPGTPAAKKIKWRLTLRNELVTPYNNKSINSIEDIENLINQSRSKRHTSATIKFSHHKTGRNAPYIWCSSTSS